MEYAELDRYLNTKSGLLGIGGSSDIRELIEREKNGDHMAHLALTTLVHSIHKAVGSMIVAMNGCDLLVFTGTVGERSAILRKRIVAHLEFLDFILDGDVNDETTAPEALTIISQKAKSRPIIVIPTDESREIAKIVAKHNDE
jgi:acetate kinase